jgi:adenosylhomocysteinase
MILDDGGDATLLVHKGAEFEAAGAVPSRRPPTRGIRGDPLRAAALAGEDGQRWTRVAAAIKGVTEETTTGVHRLY